MEDGSGDMVVVGLRRLVTADAQESLDNIASAQQARTTSANAVHDASSRSHAIMQVVLFHAETGSVYAKLTLVDLAGSERAQDMQTDSKKTRHEGAEINKSLLALKECIRALGNGSSHCPFRGSKLTQLLKDCFVGRRSQTLVIATVSPGSESCEHTLNTLRYADRLKELRGRN